VPKKPTDLVQFKLRIRDGLRRQIEREAKKRSRSANAEAVARLEQSFAQQETADLIKDTARAAAHDTFKSFATLLLKGAEVPLETLLKQLTTDQAEVPHESTALNRSGVRLADSSEAPPSSTVEWSAEKKREAGK
jgi:hypothetical protein